MRILKPLSFAIILLLLRFLTSCTLLQESQNEVSPDAKAKISQKVKAKASFDTQDGDSPDDEDSSNTKNEAYSEVRNSQVSSGTRGKEFPKAKYPSSSGIKGAAIANSYSQLAGEVQTNCKVNTKLTNKLDVNICSAAWASAADQKLDQVYQEFRSQVKGSPREKLLITAHQNWLYFRDADCEYAQNASSRKTVEPSTYFSCITRLTEHRIKDLENYLEEGQI